MLRPPLRSPCTTSAVLRRESETEPWQWLRLRSWSRSEARSDWAQGRGFSATEQILPLIRNGHGRKDPSQSATGLDIANNFSLWFREDLCQGFFPVHAASMVLPLNLRKLAAIIPKRNMTGAKRVRSTKGVSKIKRQVEKD